MKPADSAVSEGPAPSRRAFFSLAAALGLLAFGRLPSASAATEDDAESIIVHEGWVLRTGDLARLARR